MIILFRTYVLLLFTQGGIHLDKSRTYLPADTRQRIQDILKERKISQAKLAENIGLSESAFSRYLQGKTEMLGDGYIIKIAKFLNVSTDFILGETTIPDKMNYDIEELGLTANAARNLYTGKVNAVVVSQLLENPKFARLTSLLARYQDETITSGIAAQNETLNFLSSLLLGQASTHPEDNVGAKEVAQIVQQYRTPPMAADLNIINNVFSQVVRDLKQNAESQLEKQKEFSKAILEEFRQNLTKQQNSTDLRLITPKNMTDAILHMTATAGLPSHIQESLRKTMLELFTATSSQSHDE